MKEKEGVEIAECRYIHEERKSRSFLRKHKNLEEGGGPQLRDASSYPSPFFFFSLFSHHRSFLSEFHPASNPSCLV